MFEIFTMNNNIIGNNLIISTVILYVQVQQDGKMIYYKAKLSIKYRCLFHK